MITWFILITVCLQLLSFQCSDTPTCQQKAHIDHNKLHFCHLKVSIWYARSDLLQSDKPDLKVVVFKPLFTGAKDK